MGDYQLCIKGFKTKAQAEEFVKWYEGQGEQDAYVWFEERKQEGVLDVKWMPTDIKDTYPPIWEGGTLTMVVEPR